MGTKTVTVGEVLDAIEKNGYKQVKGKYIEVDGDGNLTGCAIGQGALNLGVDHMSLSGQLGMFTQKRRDLASLSNFIIYLNDRRGKTIPEIVEAAREKFAQHLDAKITVATRDYSKGI